VLHLNLDKEKKFKKQMLKDREVQFSVNSPSNVPGERRMTEVFHLETMFSLMKDQQINRYVSLTKIK
jgi:hypothetical protein